MLYMIYSTYVIYNIYSIYAIYAIYYNATSILYINTAIGCLRFAHLYQGLWSEANQLKLATGISLCDRLWNTITQTPI